MLFIKWYGLLVIINIIIYCERRLFSIFNTAGNTPSHCSTYVACRSELGRFPLIIDINNKILNYLNYLQEKDENSIVKQSLKISVDLYHSGQNSFYSSLKKMTTMISQALIVIYWMNVKLSNM